MKACLLSEIFSVFGVYLEYFPPDKPLYNVLYKIPEYTLYPLGYWFIINCIGVDNTTIPRTLQI